VFLNLSISEFNLFIPEEKRYIKDIPKSEKALAKKVILKDFTVWDKIDIYGPNITIKNLVNNFKNKYKVDIDYINYKDKILASPIDEDEKLDKTIKELYEEITGKKINRKNNYIKLEIDGSIGEANISTPTIRYILNQYNK
jgi:hypothetical protein